MIRAIRALVRRGLHNRKLKYNILHLDLDFNLKTDLDSSREDSEESPNQ